jgi:hypothetical protein
VVEAEEKQLDTKSAWKLILKEAKVLSGPVEKKKQKIKDKAEL